jgi:hypothetical protein
MPVRVSITPLNVPLASAMLAGGIHALFAGVTTCFGSSVALSWYVFAGLGADVGAGLLDPPLLLHPATM